jgi:capsular exopolysaccharide synthesis family protein
MGFAVEPRAVGRALRVGWWIVLLAFLLGGGIGFAVSSLIGPRFSTEMQFFVSTTDSSSTSDAFQGSQLAQQRVASYAGLLTGRELAGRVVDQLDLDMSPADLSGKVDATVQTGTVLIDVTVTDPSAQRAQRIAQALGEDFPTLVAGLETSRTDTATPVDVQVTDRPGPATQPFPTLAARTTVLGAVLGLVLGAGLAIARVLLDRSVTDQQEAEELAGSPVIGVVFRSGAAARRRPPDQDDTRTLEQYRQLSTDLRYLDVDQPPKAIMVTSAVPSEGKTTTVVNLALALAAEGKRVTVVEADLRRPQVTERLDLVGSVGLTDVLSGRAELDEVVQHFGDLTVLAAGPTPPNPGELLGSRQMGLLLDRLRATNDYVLIDAAPLLPVADARALAARADGVLLAVRHGDTTKAQLAGAAAALRRVGARTLGLVLTMVPRRGELASAHAYGVNYEYSAGRQPVGV